MTLLDGVVLAFVSIRKTGRVAEGEEEVLLGWSNTGCCFVGGVGEAADAAWN